MNFKRMIQCGVLFACLMGVGLCTSDASASPIVAQPSAAQALAPATMGWHFRHCCGGWGYRGWGYGGWGYGYGGYGGYPGWGSYYYGRPAIYFGAYRPYYYSPSYYGYGNAYGYGYPYASYSYVSPSYYSYASPYYSAGYYGTYATLASYQPLYSYAVRPSVYAYPTSYFGGYSAYGYPTYGYSYSPYSYYSGYYGGFW